MNQVTSILESLPFAEVPDEIIKKLSTLPRESTLNQLREIVFNMEGEITDRAIDAILKIDADYGRSILLNLYREPQWEWFFCDASFAYGDESFAEPLCEILLMSPDPNARLLAAGALEELGTLDSIHSLITALSDEGEDYEGRKISEQAQISIRAIRTRLE